MKFSKLVEEMRTVRDYKKEPVEHRIIEEVLEAGKAVTGIAGPGGGTPQKPVGLVYIALSHSNGVDAKELKLWGERSRIRNVASLHALDMVRKHITGSRELASQEN